MTLKPYVISVIQESVNTLKSLMVHPIDKTAKDAKEAKNRAVTYIQCLEYEQHKNMDTAIVMIRDYTHIYI